MRHISYDNKRSTRAAAASSVGSKHILTVCQVHNRQSSPAAQNSQIAAAVDATPHPPAVKMSAPGHRGRRSQSMRVPSSHARRVRSHYATQHDSQARNLPSSDAPPDIGDADVVVEGAVANTFPGPPLHPDVLRFFMDVRAQCKTITRVADPLHFARCAKPCKTTPVLLSKLAELCTSRSARTRALLSI